MAQTSAIQIARTSLPLNDTFYIALRKIFGIGRTTGLAVAEACGISKEMRVREGGREGGRYQQHRRRRSSVGNLQWSQCRQGLGSGQDSFIRCMLTQAPE